jgi:hypothetical protein
MLSNCVLEAQWDKNMLFYKKNLNGIILSKLLTYYANF